MFNRYYKVLKLLFNYNLLALFITVAYASPQSNIHQLTETPILKVGYINFAPLYETKNNQTLGTLSDKTHLIFDDLSLNYRELPLPTKRLFSKLKSGLIHIWCGIKIDAFKDNLFMGETALHYLTFNIYALNSPVKIRKKSDLKGKKVILLFGYNYDDWGKYIRDPQNNISYIEVKSHKAALKLLRGGRFEYLLNYQAPMKATIKLDPIDNLFSHNISRLPIVFNISKKVKNAELLLKNLDMSLANLISKGEVIVE